jgi:hypothetical protein
MEGLDQLQLGGAGEPLDAGLLSERSRPVGDPDDERELNRAAATRVAAGGAGSVCSQAPRNVGRPSAVEAPVGAAEQAHTCHTEGFASELMPTCRGAVAQDAGRPLPGAASADTNPAG